MYYKVPVFLFLLLTFCSTRGQSTFNIPTNLTTCEHKLSTGFTLSSKIKAKAPIFPAFTKPEGAKENQYLDYQYIFGYTYSPNFKSAMNMHPEVGIGIGFKKYRYTTGVTGTCRFIKTREPYKFLSDTGFMPSRYFINLAFAFYLHVPFYNEDNREIFVEAAPGFEVLYLEERAQTVNQSRRYAMSLHATGGLGYRYTLKSWRFFQVMASINYNHLSYGGLTDIPGQYYFNFRFTTGFLVRDDWATKRNHQKANSKY